MNHYTEHQKAMCDHYRAIAKARREELRRLKAEPVCYRDPLAILRCGVSLRYALAGVRQFSQVTR